MTFFAIFDPTQFVFHTVFVKAVGIQNFYYLTPSSASCCSTTKSIEIEVMGVLRRTLTSKRR